MGYETLYEYSPEATLIKEIDAQKNETKVLYDKLGRVVLVTLADQTKHQYGYNLANQITLYKNPLDEKIEFSYSKTGKLLSLRDPAKRKTEFKYDKYDRVISKTNPFLEIEEMEQEHYGYNPDSTLSTITRVDGSKLYLNYDLNQNITTIIAQSKSGEVEELKYGYDELSNLTKAIAKQSNVVLDYDEKQSLSREEQNGIELHTLYDEKSHALSQLNFLDQTLSYAYDDVANVKSIEINQSSKIEFKYDNNGLLTKRAYPNKTKECYEYDELKSISEIKSSKTKISYGHNEVGDIWYKLNHEDEDATSYRYNGRNELIQAGREEFNYNRAGNRVKEGWEYNYKNQLTQTPKYIYDYDERGNLKSKIDKTNQEQTLYTFNLFNQLLSVKKQNQNQESIEEFHYTYDALNRRVKKTTLKGTTQTIYHYLYNGHNIVAILDNNKKTLATIVHDKTIDTPLSITTYQNQLRELTEVEESYYHELPKAEKEFIDKKRKSRTYYYHRDHQGSIHNLTNEKGEVVESFRYDESYGSITKHTKTEETLNPYCYTGREFETEELYYYRARYYDPTVGRFISSDPIEFMAGDFNFYRYVGNEPVGWVDPSGLYSMLELEIDFYDGVIAVGNVFVGAADSITMGAVSAVSERTNTMIYGADRAKSAREMTQNSATYNVSKTVVDYVPIPTNLGKTAVKKVVKEGLENVIEDKATEIISEETGIDPSLVNKKRPSKTTTKKNKVDGGTSNGGGSLTDSKKNDGTVKVKGEEKKPKTKKDCPPPPKGEPVNPVLGVKILHQESPELVVDAPIPLIWKRTYASDYAKRGILGQGWRVDIEYELERRDDMIVFTDALGREILFDDIEVGNDVVT